MFKYIFLLLLLCSCATQKVVLSNKEPEYFTGYEKDQSFFISGFFQEKNTLADYACDGYQNIHSVQSKQNFANSFLSLITGNVYNPREARVYCIEEDSK